MTRRASKLAKKSANATIEDIKPLAFQHVAVPPTRVHAQSYHWPLLLGGDGDRGAALLAWFETIEDEREMPWRKAWIDPTQSGEGGLEERVQRRAYEVWISEISRFSKSCEF